MDKPTGDSVLLGQHRGAEIRLPAAAALGGTEQTDDPPCPPRAFVIIYMPKVTAGRTPPTFDGKEPESGTQRPTTFQLL